MTKALEGFLRWTEVFITNGQADEEAAMDEYDTGRWRLALSMIDRAEQEQGVLAINWHQRVFNPWVYREWQEMYVRIVEECRRRGAWVGPLGKIADWWVSHPESVSERMDAACHTRAVC
jgi:hypothetical protein